MAKEKHPGGRPSKYNPDLHPLLAEYMATAGLTDAQMAEKLGITPQTLNNWKKDHTEFFDSLKIGKEKPDYLVENALLQRALGFEHDEDKIFQYNGEPVVVPTKKHYPPDPTSMIFWLKNRRPDRWRDKQNMEHSTIDENGKPKGLEIIVKRADS